MNVMAFAGFLIAVLSFGAVGLSMINAIHEIRSSVERIEKKLEEMESK